MGFSTYTDLITEVRDNAKHQTAHFRWTGANVANITAGRWGEMMTATGEPGALSQSGTAGAAVACSQSSTNALKFTGDVSTDTRHILSSSLYNVNTNWCFWLWVDVLLYYPSLVVTGTPTTLDNTVTLPRYTSGDGVYALCAVQTALGAATPSLTFTYTNSTPTGSRTGRALVADANSRPVSAIFQHDGGGGPFMPMQSGDTGVSKLDSYVIDSGGTTGTVCMYLVKPLFAMPILNASVPMEIDYLTELIGASKILDGACLRPLILTIVGSGAVPQSGHISMGWG